ncbi:putative methicillin resistance protein [Candidatus Methanoperedens nitroreducens]|uniref:Putative methicillin resistance protein n=1 Tax=Candidatus Methanoperedens nitratireducens TaxID=1392998 RepID=A0A062V4L3_9EURY|nr:peptidoglycan bridge formation glycyltransferase FemA/FemB family protein [Candidatus Methanoperedens nitroreducens]KCZ72282.1 putative methicillin resistance protein [Candidatus Methanoperedens nitroreducens]MDJ1420747.1 peptidoglycan bridge formation glycyltransferase FemA/FemB family protein [Candidatus Methanoperedens sp.]
MIEITESPDVTGWREFVYNHPHGNIFQMPEMAEVYKHTKNYEPITLAAVESNTDKILALVNGVVIKELNGFMGQFTARSVIQGGPLSTSGEEGKRAVKLLMEYYSSVAGNKALYTQIRNMWDTSEISDVLKDIGYEYEEHLNILVDLTVTKEDAWNRLSKSKRRYIRKAKNSGTVIEEAEDIEDIKSFYGILSETYSRAKLPLADMSLFISAFELLMPKNFIKYFLARNDGKTVGGIMAPLFKGNIYEWYVCGSRKYSELYPSEMVTWYPIQWGIENKLSTFDFGGAGKPDEEYGVREFKKQFGGDVVNFGRYEKIHSRLKMRLVDTGYSIYKKTFL